VNWEAKGALWARALTGSARLVRVEIPDHDGQASEPVADIQGHAAEGPALEGHTGARIYVVATPIGNLEDISLRALRILKEADLIACEDTRHTQKLLTHYGITTRTVSYHDHNEMERAAELIENLKPRQQLALVTDAGMPGISDPGFRLIALAVSRGIQVIPIPGPSAFLAALVASGLPTDAFHFGGFLPSRRAQRRKLLESIASADFTQAFYESPHRIVESLEDIAEVLGLGRRLVLAREVTKLHEEFLRGTAGELLGIARSRELKGEITLLISKCEPMPQAAQPAISVGRRVEEMMASEGLDEKTALKRVAREMGISKSDAYRELQRTKS